AQGRYRWRGLDRLTTRTTGRVRHCRASCRYTDCGLLVRAGPTAPGPTAYRPPACGPTSREKSFFRVPVTCRCMAVVALLFFSRCILYHRDIQDHPPGLEICLSDSLL